MHDSSTHHPAVKSRLDVLLTIEGVLGAILVDGGGHVVGSINLSEGDTARLRQAVFSVVDRGGSSGAASTGTSHSFATFELHEGQICVSAGRQLTLVAATDPGLDSQSLKGVLAAVLAALETAHE